MRDDFTEEVKRTLAARVGNHCSNPGCRALTSGPQVDPGKALNVGVAAHITAAAPAGPRYNPVLLSQERCHADNGIWLCQTCAKLVDNDPSQFPAHVLRAWKAIAEHNARYTIGKTASSLPTNSVIGPTLSAPVKPLQSSQKPTEYVRTNIKCINVRTVDIALNRDRDHITFKEINYETGIRAAIASFRNAPSFGNQISDAENVTAHLILRDEDGQEIGTGVSRVCWLNSSYDMVDIDVGESEHVVLLVLKEQSLFIPFWKRRCDGGGDAITLESVEVNNRVAAIEVTLLDSRKYQLLPKVAIKISLENDKMAVTLKQH